jgi:hypothetical protein
MMGETLSLPKIFIVREVIIAVLEALVSGKAKQLV